VKKQNFILVLASYFFYASWDYRFLLLLLLSTLIDFFTGIRISEAKTSSNKKIWLAISMALNIGILVFFKYFNFIADNLMFLFQSIGMPRNTIQYNAIQPIINIILPIGISFYTFHGISYVLDIYFKRIIPTKSFSEYALFVCFFPLLIAGPIERANHLLPQLKKRRKFLNEDAVDGLKQILWGLFKKVVIADNCAEYVNYAFNQYESLPGSTLAIGVVFFSFQIYCDFSGYTDMAIGIGKLFGIQLLKNFSFPYFSTSIAEFWRKWHISLTSWFKDYLYIPLGGSRGSKFKTIVNTLVVFLVSGFWHGANWTFIIWGLIHFSFFLPGLLSRNNQINNGEINSESKGSGLFQLVSMLFTFCLVSFAWIFFRATNLDHAIGYIQSIGTHPFWINPFLDPTFKKALLVILLLIFFNCIEWMGRNNNFAIEAVLVQKSRFIRWSFYSSLLFLIGMYMHAGTSPFIYFQF